jgi:ketosteroid isomerase-like protein
MRLTFTRLAILFLLNLTAVAQTPQTKSAMKEMVETEQAFSKTAEVKSTRDAFMEFIAEDGLLFRPLAVNGKKWMNEHPVPPSDKHPLLAWQPAFAKMSEAGDLGFTTGPWEFKNDIKDKTPSGYGHFVTLWKKQADGSWKFVVDLGISHPQSGGELKIWQVEGSSDKKIVKSVDVAKSKKLLLEWDHSFSNETAKRGLSAAFQSYAAGDVRLYLPQKLPFLGRTAAVEALTPIKGLVTYRAIAGDVSRSGDLGYTHGTYDRSTADDPQKVDELGNYLRIWQKVGGVWRIALEVLNPVP